MSKHAATAIALVLVAFAGVTQAATMFEINPWIIPPGVARYPTINATCGDALQFVWSVADGEHGVFKLAPGSNGTCPTTYDNSTGIELAPITVGGNITYVVQDEPSFYIVCPFGNGSHCNLGQKILINVTCPAAAAANLAPPAVGAANASAVTTGPVPGANATTAPAANAAVVPTPSPEVLIAPVAPGAYGTYGEAGAYGAGEYGAAGAYGAPGAYGGAP